MKKKCCYLVLVYNDIENTLETVQGIQNQICEYPADIIVIDNHSQEKYRQVLKSTFRDSSVRYVYRDKNDGYAGGNNWGWKKLRSRYEYLFIVNNDIRFLNRHITEKMIDTFDKNPGIGILAPVVLYGDGQKQENSFLFRAMFKDGIYGHRFVTEKTYSEESSVVGCFLAVSTDRVKENCLFDGSFFMYGEEFELALRVWKSGYAAARLTEPAFAVYHKGGKDPYEKPGGLWKHYLVSRNLAVCIRHFSGADRAWFAVLLVLSILKKLILGPGNWKMRLVSVEGCVKGIFYGLSGKSRKCIGADAKKYLSSQQNKKEAGFRQKRVVYGRKANGKHCGTDVLS